MANTYTALYYHIVFSTKNRVDYIKPDIEGRVWAYIGGVARKHGLIALQVGGMQDHIHALVLAGPTFAPSEIAKFLKGDSSRWIHEEFPRLRDFAWQDGYGAFTVSKSNIGSVIVYIQNQHEHHQKKTFQEEYLEFLKKHQIEYDERYLWG
ncbi:MAG TPA: IS200/IS605 family transposase [Blastocatellia bacterium]|nr:IS200/IS605 family transposase [Blastocatellia bacterium]